MSWERFFFGPEEVKVSSISQEKKSEKIIEKSEKTRESEKVNKRIFLNAEQFFFFKRNHCGKKSLVSEFSFTFG